MLSALYIKGQTVVFHENFENPSGADSVISSPTGSWGLSSVYFADGYKSDSCQVKYNDTTYLTTNTFSTLGMQYVILEFDQICKIEFFDAAYIEISTNNGISWIQLTSGQYLGSGQFAAIGNKFNATSYSDWLPVNNNTVPSNTWWKHESFDLSSIASNAAQVKLRFALADINSSGAAGNYGWLIDKIKINAAPDELIPPSVSLVSPYPTDSVFSKGPFTISASITDNSGIDSALLIYNLNGGINDTVVMVFNYGTVYSGTIDTIPAFSVGDTICYRVWAMDSSLSQNTAIAPQSGCEQFVIYTPQPYPGCTSAITSFPYYESFDQNFFSGSGTPSYPGVLGTDWSRDPSSTSSYMWLVYSGSTPTTSTGPTSDHSSGNGNYLYTESSYGSTSAVATLLTPCMDLNAISVPVLEFYYHMWGSSQGELHVDIWYGNSWHLDIMQPIIGDQGNQWIKQSVNIGVFKGAATKIRFRAIKGNSIYSDIAIDDIKVWQPPLYDAGMVTIDKPISPANTGVQPVKASFANFGSATLNKITINWQVNGQLKTPFVWTGILTPGAVADSIQIGTHNFISGPSNIKIWTSLPNDSVDGFSYNDTVQTSIIACTSPLRGEFTIGGVNADFINFDQAIYALENCGIDSSIVFKVNSGVYTEQLNIDSIPGASQTNRITFTSANGDSTSVELSYSPNSSIDPYIVQFNGASFITFKNMTIASTSTSYGRAFVFALNASHNTIENCVIQLPSILSSYFSAFYSASTQAEYNSFINNDIYNGYYTIYFYGVNSTTKSHGNKVIGNRIQGFRYYGVYFMYQDGFDISKNIFINDSTASSSYPVYAYYADGAYQITKNQVIAKGTSTIYGIRVYYGTSTQASPGLIANNFVMLYGSAQYPYGLYVYNCNYLNIYYNTIVCATDSAPNGRVLYQSTGSNLRIKNNIFSNTSLGYVYYIGTPTAIVEADYNDLFANSSNFAYWSGYVNDLSSLKAASGKETHSVSILPTFYGFKDLHLIYSPLSSAGTPLPSVPDDIDGELRSQTSPAMGADEQPPIPIDAGVLEVMNPSASEPEAAIIQPKILVKNFGTDTLYDFTVKMALNGLPLDTQSYSFTLLPFAFDTLIFDSIQVPPGHNNLCFKTYLTTDTNLFNDELCKYFYGVPMVDMGIVNMITPDSGQCFSSSEPIKVTIKNYGSLAINFAQLPVTIHTSVSAPIPITIPNVIVNTGLLQPGASAPITIVNNLDMNHMGDYIFNIWTSVPSDGDHTNDSMETKKIEVFPTVTTFPYAQDFENFVPSANTSDPGQLAEGYAQNNTSTDYVWYVGHGSTYTTNTGPSNDHSLGTASGKYCYAEAFGYYAGTANLVTPCIDLSNNTHPTLRYFYYMFGSSIHSLRVDVYSNGQWYYSIGHQIGAQQSSTADEWKQDFIDLTAYAGQVIKLRFRAVKVVGYEADIAIDDISIFEPVQKDAGISNTFQKPATNFAAQGSQVPIQVKIENYGLDTLTDLYVGYIAGPNAPVLEHWTGSIPPYSYQLYEFTKKYTVAAGEIKICAYTSYTGDMNSSNDTGCISFTGVSIFPVPYADDFEGTNYFFSTGGLKQWTRGYPNKATFTTPHSGNNAWVTDLNDVYMNNSNDYLYTPFFDLSKFPNTYLRFWHRLQTQSGYDGGAIEISTDGGNTFSFLGYIGDPMSSHWYNANIGGTHFWSGADSGWIHPSYSLGSIVSSQPVQFRFKFFSDNTINNYDGWMIDDFEITPNPIANDAGISKIINPANYTSQGSNVSVTVELKNYGSSTLTQIPVNYRIDNGTPINQIWTGALTPGSTAQFTFTTSYTATSAYILQTWTSISGDSHWFNDSAEIKMARDISVLAIIDPKPIEIYGDSVDVTIQFKNMGNDTISTCDFSYDINGGNTVTETWNGSIAPGGIGYYTFNKKWKVTYGIGNFCARSLLSGDSDGGNDKKCQYVSGTIGISQSKDLLHFKLTQNEPNPFNEKAYATVFVNKNSKATITITDVTGRIIYSNQINLNAGETKLVIDRGALTSGIYFYEVRIKENSAVIKLLIGD